VRVATADVAEIETRKESFAKPAVFKSAAREKSRNSIKAATVI